eukprot:TRINITY_DN10111_c0_g2_i3.p3 TRINITY_DN10111_c0_g2~~TRINITY_DN10111_c0_g2_i3.p3  ORF type:complete len:202 (+),score=25.05 TRINITY_DN10111_c0_g2_i3:615-1220(+)
MENSQIKRMMNNLKDNEQVYVPDLQDAIHRLLPYMTSTQKENMFSQFEGINNVNTNDLFNASKVQDKFMFVSYSQFFIDIQNCFLDCWLTWLEGVQQSLRSCVERSSLEVKDFIKFILIMLQNDHGMNELQVRIMINELVGIGNDKIISKKLITQLQQQIQSQDKLQCYDVVLKIQDMLDWGENLQKVSGAVNSGNLPELA